MFDLSRILRIKYWEYLDKAFTAALSQQQAGDNLKHASRVSSG